MKELFSMIYLQPTGGLGNRMRAIDSMISLCQKHKRNLAIIWKPTSEINCDFSDVFKKVRVPGVKVKVVEKPLLSTRVSTRVFRSKNCEDKKRLFIQDI